MPVTKLLVEGELDAEVLEAILEGRPTVVQGGTKTSLAPKARSERAGGAKGVCYLRDRDYDFDPPATIGRPVQDAKTEDDSTLGWYWCRHSIENYLIDPAVVERATALPRAEYETELVRAAKEIRHYQAARWAVGIARRGLLPPYKLSTYPTELHNHEFRLPGDRSEPVQRSWAMQHVAAFLTAATKSTAPAAFAASLTAQAARLTDELLATPANALLWCSGKDLLAAMEKWLKSKGIAAPGAFRATLRDWVIEEPESAVDLLPEWKALVEAVQR